MRVFHSVVIREKPPSKRPRKQLLVYIISELLLVTRPNDNHSPGPVIREVSP